MLEIIAHRGAHGPGAPENSMEAFERALWAGADAIELDVHATADGVCVVAHDGDVVVRPGAAAHSTPIASIRAAELRRVAPALPRLADVLQLVQRHCTVYVEIKPSGIEELVARVITASGAECAVHSFDHRVAVTMRTLMPSVATGVLLRSRLVDVAHALRAAGARDLWQWHEQIDASLVADAASAGARVIAWTANSHDEWARLRTLGVAGVCTDHVGSLAAWRRDADH